MMLTATALCLALLAAQEAAPQRRDSRPFQTDQTVPVTKGTRLHVENFAGEVVVRAWDRDSLQVRARHTPRTKVQVRQAQGGVFVSASGSGARGSVDYEIQVPAWMPVKIEGTFNFVTVEGAQSEVSAETTRGDIVIRGGSGTVTAESIEGEVIVEGAKGRINVSSVNEDVRVTGASGDVHAETHNGDITLRDIRAASVEVETINGDVILDAVPPDRGKYRVTTHNGSITVAVPDASNVSFVVRTYQGSFNSAIPLNGPPRDEVRRGRRNVYTLGNGSAEMELESFGGSIRVRRAGTLNDKK